MNGNYASAYAADQLTRDRLTQALAQTRAGNILVIPEPTMITRPATILDLPEWASFARAICNAPNDDLPRMVAADWLEENEMWFLAGFIRASIEYGNAPTDPAAAETLWNFWAGAVEPITSDTGVTRWKTQESACIAIRSRMSHDAFRWRPDITRPITPFVQRGFLSTYLGLAGDLIAHGARIFAEHPIRHVIDTGNVRPDREREYSGRPNWFWERNHLFNETLNLTGAGTTGAGGEIVPWPWYDRLRYGRHGNASNGLTHERRHYPTAELALYDLSLAVVDYYRHQAGLDVWNRTADIGTHARKFRYLGQNQHGDYYDAPPDTDPFFKEFLGILETARRNQRA